MLARVTWLGHASAQLAFGDSRVLIDPLGPKRCLAVPAAGTILITHAHVDHLNAQSELEHLVKVLAHGESIALSSGSEAKAEDRVI